MKELITRIILIYPTSEATEEGVEMMKKWKWVKGNSEVADPVPVVVSR